MTTPVQQQRPATEVPVFVVVAPGTDPNTIEVLPRVTKLGWKFAEMSDGDLIDLVKQADQYVSALEKWVDAAKGVMKQRLPVPTEPGTETITRGRFFEAHYVKSTRTALDQEKTKAFLGDRLPEFVKTTEVLTLKITPISQTPGVAST